MSRSTDSGRTSGADSGILGAVLALAVMAAFLSFASVDADSGAMHKVVADPCEDAVAAMDAEQAESRTDDFVRILCRKASSETALPQS